MPFKRLLIGLGLGGAAMYMAHIVDTGVTRSWPRSLDVSFVMAMLGIGLIGCGFIAQDLRVLTGQPEVRWFPRRATITQRSGLIPVLGTAAAVLLAVFIVSVVAPDMTERAALAGIGLFLASLLLLRSRALWRAPETVEWRKLFGDRAVSAMLALLAICFVVLAFVV